MELIKKLRPKYINGKCVSYAIFKCPDSYCGKEVIKRSSDGKKAKSCGCMSHKLQAQTIKGKKHTEEHNKKISEGNKGKIISEEVRQIIRESNVGQKRTEETIQNLSKSHIGQKAWNKGLTHLDDNRILAGELSSNWQGGKSFEIYPQEFNKELKNYIKTRDLNVCQTPGCMETEHLCIHHIDYDKKNNSPDNLITLCVNCHVITNGKNNRNYWINYYKEIVSAYL